MIFLLSHFLQSVILKLHRPQERGKEAKYILGHDSLKSHSTYETKGN